MSPDEQVVARSRAYQLFAHLWLNGLSAEVWPAVQATPGLSEDLPRIVDEDETAADHYDLFGLNVLPYASLFLDPSGHLGGPVTRYVQHQLHLAGCRADLSTHSADHIGLELTLLGHLCSQEAATRKAGQITAVEQLQRHQRRFLDEHLLWWLPVLVQAVARQGYDFYTRLAEVTWELVLDHRESLPIEAGSATAPVLADPPPLLEQPETGLKEIAAYLATPPWSGFYLSPRDVAWIGRSERLPRGFGGRAQLLSNLLRSATTFDRMEAVLERMLALQEDWSRHYRSIEQRSLIHVADIARTWQARLQLTVAIIARIREAVVRG